MRIFIASNTPLIGTANSVTWQQTDRLLSLARRRSANGALNPKETLALRVGPPGKFQLADGRLETRRGL